LRTTVHKDFNENEAAARRKYGKVVIQFSLTVMQVEGDKGAYLLTSVGPIEVKAHLTDRVALELKRGDLITIEGELEDYIEAGAEGNLSLVKARIVRKGK
jgi:hypothetical protein